MEFKKFSSIENSSRIKTIDKIKEYGLNKGEFSISEKTHGSNLSVYINQDDIKIAKRSGFVDDLYSFFKCNQVLSNREKFINVYNHLKSKYPKLDYIVLCGEWFGGLYNHKDVLRDDNAKKVQSGIHYSPSNLFYIFDIKINNMYLSVDEVNEICEKYNLFYAKELFRGTLNECLQYPNKFQTKIPKWLNLPEIENNYCEGVVIRPIQPTFFPNGERVILKNKNEKWSEQKTRNIKPKKIIKFSKQFNELHNEALSLITENRLKNVISKIGQITQKDFGKLNGSFNKDVIEELLKDYREQIESLDKSERKQLNKVIGKDTANLIKKHFINIIDGVF